MANFNFTVRATDSDGAYADRNFAITINNTRVERYMVVDNIHAYTSPDLVNWTTRNNQGGWDVSYGNSMWLIATTSATPAATPQGLASLGGSAYYAKSTFVVRKSPDGVNFSIINQADMTFLKPDGTAFVVPSVATNYMVNGRLSFSNGFFWYPMSWGTNYTTTAANYTSYIARSPDGITWTMFASPNKGAFYYDNSQYGHYFRSFHKVTDSGADLFLPSYGTANGHVGGLYGWKSSDLGATWTPVIDSTGKVNNSTAFISTYLTRINGLYLAANPSSTSQPVMVSNDGYNWSPCNVMANSINGQVADIVYANGTLYAHSFSSTSLSGSYSSTLTSTDGINWTNVTPAGMQMSANSPSTNNVMTLIYKNGYVIHGQSSASTSSQYPMYYQFAGSADGFVRPATPFVGSGTPTPFTYTNGIAAMGS